MYYVLIAIHIISCLFLIASILLQAGRGGGLTDTFSGQTQSVLGTQAPVVLKRATTISAIVFITMSLVLAIYTSRRSRSLFQQMSIPQNLPISGNTMPTTMPLGTTGDAAVPMSGTADTSGTTEASK